MGIISMASGNSVWRGLDYCKENKVIEYMQVSEYEYQGLVSGSNKEKYSVFLDVQHPRKSKCNCPHADGTRIICKHIVALYFSVYPKEVDKFLKEQELAQKKYEEYEEELYEKTMKYIRFMSKNDLQNALIGILNIAPEWVYERFVRDWVGFW